MVAGNKKVRSFRRVGHGKGDGYASLGFGEAQNCPTTGRKSRGRLWRPLAKRARSRYLHKEGRQVLVTPAALWGTSPVIRESQNLRPGRNGHFLPGQLRYWFRMNRITTAAMTLAIT